MSEEITPAEAQEALATVERSRQEVIDEVGMPLWYWWVLAIGWIVIGVLADLGRPWLTAAATFGFGTMHAVIYQFVGGGRHRNPRLSVRADTIGPSVSTVVLGSLFLLMALTLVATLLIAADGAAHPSTIASVFVAILILLGGPAAMGALRRRSRKPLR